MENPVPQTPLRFAFAKGPRVRNRQAPKPKPPAERPMIYHVERLRGGRPSLATFPDDTAALAHGYELRLKGLWWVTGTFKPKPPKEETVEEVPVA